jgi:hypothetical protein
LKACVARKTERFEFPDKPRAELSWNHDLRKLLGAAGLAKQLTADAGANPDLAANWAMVVNWTEASRYDRTSTRRSRSECIAL